MIVCFAHHFFALAKGGVIWMRRKPFGWVGPLVGADMILRLGVNQLTWAGIGEGFFVAAPANVTNGAVTPETELPQRNHLAAAEAAERSAETPTLEIHKDVWRERAHSPFLNGVVALDLLAPKAFGASLEYSRPNGNGWATRDAY